MYEGVYVGLNVIVGDGVINGVFSLLFALMIVFDELSGFFFFFFFLLLVVAILLDN